MESVLLSYLNYWEPLKYIIIFLGMMVEGDTVLFIASFLAHQGLIDPTAMLLTALWGMILGDNLWYSAGLKLRNSSSWLNQWAEKLAKPFDEHLIKKPFRTIFIAKFTYGINHAIILRAGTLRTKWSEIEKSDILATLLWMIIVGGLGYFSSASFSYVRHYLKFAEVALLLGLLIFFSLEYLITKGTKKNL
ncbi:MAG: VTT domain-containing protein [Candidatus Harrisonbacteria bacterium]|nr:VTT domain-containing protein [Candidatus Harrisonbacteria bacterium]